ncbi:hypothetical protein Tco_0035727, partial [Tanacetum coccineum]
MSQDGNNRKEAEVVHDETEHEESVLDLEKAKSDQAIEIASLKKRIEKLERRRKFRTTRLRRLKKVGTARRIESSNDSLVNETQERHDEDLMFDTGVLDDDEVFVDVTTFEKEEQSTKTGEAVTTAAKPKSITTAAKTTPKAKGIIFHDQEDQVSKPTIFVTQPLVKDKGKGIMQEPEVPLKRKDQVGLDEQMARDIQA